MKKFFKGLLVFADVLLIIGPAGACDNGRIGIGTAVTLTLIGLAGAFIGVYICFIRKK